MPESPRRGLTARSKNFRAGKWDKHGRRGRRPRGAYLDLRKIELANERKDNRRVEKAVEKDAMSSSPRGLASMRMLRSWSNRGNWGASLVMPAGPMLHWVRGRVTRLGRVGKRDAKAVAPISPMGLSCSESKRSKEQWERAESRAGADAFPILFSARHSCITFYIPSPLCFLCLRLFSGFTFSVCAVLFSPDLLVDLFVHVLTVLFFCCGWQWEENNRARGGGGEEEGKIGRVDTER